MRWIRRTDRAQPAELGGHIEPATGSTLAWRLLRSRHRQALRYMPHRQRRGETTRHHRTPACNQAFFRQGRCAHQPPFISAVGGTAGQRTWIQTRDYRRRSPSVQWGRSSKTNQRLTGMRAPSTLKLGTAPTGAVRTPLQRTLPSSVGHPPAAWRIHAVFLEPQPIPGHRPTALRATPTPGQQGYAGDTPSTGMLPRSPDRRYLSNIRDCDDQRRSGPPPARGRPSRQPDPRIRLLLNPLLPPRGRRFADIA